LVIRGRYRGAAPTLTLSGSTRDGAAWEATAEPAAAADRTVAQLWARAALRDLEDAYASDPYASEALEQRIVRTSLRFGVLCRFTAFVALDTRVVNEAGQLHKVIQPVELPAGWAPQAPMPAQFGAMPMLASAAMETSGGLPRRPMHRASGGASAPQRQPKPRLGRPALDDSMPGGESELATARTQAAEEARRLEQPAASEFERRDALDDLASRLDALVRHLESQGIDAGPLRSIVELLRDETISTTERWDRAHRALREFAQVSTSAGRPFWKRT
jgi:Ca-activated chloride channel family protein